MPLVSDEDDFTFSTSPDAEPTTSDGPPGSSTAPQGSVEPLPEPGVAKEDLPEFDPRYREDFQGLLYLGALTHKFEFCGHEFVIRTLTTDEILSVGQLIKDYEDSISATRAYATAMVAASVVTVDGKPLPTPFKEEPGNATLHQRFRVVKQWFPFTIDFIYSEFLALEGRQTQVFEALGKAFG